MEVLDFLNLENLEKPKSQMKRIEILSLENL